MSSKKPGPGRRSSNETHDSGPAAIGTWAESTSASILATEAYGRRTRTGMSQSKADGVGGLLRACPSWELGER